MKCASTHFCILILLAFSSPIFSQTDSLLQNLIEEQSVDSSILKPNKMLFTQKWIWGENGLLQGRYAGKDLAESRKIDLRIRRQMLQIHQIGGFVTLAGMVAQGILGSQLYNGNYKIKDAHENLGMAINLTYGITAINSLFAPPSSFQRDKKISSIRLHKWLAVVHLSGMIATNILASQIENNPNLKPYHRAAAYTAFAGLATSMIVIKF